MITFGLIIIILVQRSASDGMGLSGSSSNSFMSGRTAASFVTHLTAGLAVAFILTSLALGIITTRNHRNDASIVDHIDTISRHGPLSPTQNSLEPPVGSPATPAPMAAPAKPSVPRPQ